jgi:hypothetical protein
VVHYRQPHHNHKSTRNLKILLRNPAQILYQFTRAPASSFNHPSRDLAETLELRFKTILWKLSDASSKLYYFSKTRAHHKRWKTLNWAKRSPNVATLQQLSNNNKSWGSHFHGPSQGGPMLSLGLRVTSQLAPSVILDLHQMEGSSPGLKYFAPGLQSRTAGAL